MDNRATAEKMNTALKVMLAEVRTGPLATTRSSDCCNESRCTNIIWIGWAELNHWLSKQALRVTLHMCYVCFSFPNFSWKVVPPPQLLLRLPSASCQPASINWERLRALGIQKHSPNPVAFPLSTPYPRTAFLSTPHPHPTPREPLQATGELRIVGSTLTLTLDRVSHSSPSSVVRFYFFPAYLWTIIINFFHIFFLG